MTDYLITVIEYLLVSSIHALFCVLLLVLQELVPVSRMIQWAAAQPPPTTPFLKKTPPLPGRLEVLRWARENGCPWDESTTSEVTDVPQFHFCYSISCCY